MLKYFVLVCNLSRASSTRTRRTSIHIGWRAKKNLAETFKSQLEKNINVIHLFTNSALKLSMI